MPVHNGGAYLKDCVQSILAQTYKDFYLLILENKSTDGSADWLATITDLRVQVFPAEKFLSIEDNWARITSLKKEEFATLIGHDDILLPNFLEEMAMLISKFPDASLYQSHFSLIDANGDIIRKCLPMNEILSGPEFLEGILTKKLDVFGTGFIFRSADYDAFGGIPPFPSLLFADFALWIHLASLSSVAVSKENLFKFRLHYSESKAASNSKMQKAFLELLSFLKKLKGKSPAYSTAILTKAEAFIKFYCISISHRILRTKEITPNSIKEWVKNCDRNGRELGFTGRSLLENDYQLRLAVTIEKFPFLRHLFLLFKKIYKKPVRS